MRIINSTGFPASWERACRALAEERATLREAERMKYAPKPVYSVTELLSPPYQLRLAKEYGDSLEIEAERLLWTMYGSAAHVVARLGAGTGRAEERLTYEGKSAVVTGAADLVELEIGPATIIDYKFVKKWLIMMARPDWQERAIRTICRYPSSPNLWPALPGDSIEHYAMQVNLYAWLLARNGVAVERAELVVAFKDWSASELARNRDGRYPPKDWARYSIPLLPPDVVGAFAAARVQLLNKYMSAPIENVPPCSPEERWTRDECFAVVVDGRTRALKLFPVERDEEAARSAAQAAASAFAASKGARVEHRVGARVRCAEYCDVARVCPIWQAEKAKLIPKPEDERFGKE